MEVAFAGLAPRKSLSPREELSATVGSGDRTLARRLLSLKRLCPRTCHEHVDRRARCAATDALDSVERPVQTLEWHEGSRLRVQPLVVLQEQFPQFGKSDER